MGIIRYSISSDDWGDGKSVCLWRLEGSTLLKIARFQNDKAARLFARDFTFPVSDKVRKRLHPE